MNKIKKALLLALSLVMSATLFAACGKDKGNGGNGSSSSVESSSEVSTPVEDSSEEVSSDEASSDEISSDEVSSDEVSSDEVSSDEVSSEEESSVEDSSIEDSSSVEESSEEVSSEEESSEEVSSEEESSEDESSEEESSEEPELPDTTAPVLSAIDETQFADLKVGDKITIPTVTATDDKDGDVTVYVFFGTMMFQNPAQMGVEMTMEMAGNYIIKYSAQDEAGNVAEKTINVTVAECDHTNVTWTEENGVKTGVCGCGQDMGTINTSVADKVEIVLTDETATLDLSGVTDLEYTVESAVLGDADVAGTLGADGEYTISLANVDETKVWGDKNVIVTIKTADGATHEIAAPVFAVTKVINSLADLSVVQATTTDVAIFGYYVLGGDIDGNGATLANTVQIGNQNNGFRGTLDGRGHKISNFNTGNYGIFGNLAYGGEIKNVTLDINKSFSNVIAYATRSAKITDVTVNVKAVAYAGWYELASEINNSTVSNLTVTYAEGIIFDGAYALCKTYNETTFTNVNITTEYKNAEKITTSGKPDGVTVTLLNEPPAVTATYDTKLAADADTGLVIVNENVKSGDEVTVSVNDATVTATATEDGTVTVDLSEAGLTAGTVYEVYVACGEETYLYTDVLFATKVIRTLSDLSAVAYTGDFGGSGSITGYYALTGNIDGGGATTSGGTTGDDQNADGFRGTFDGRGYTISNFKAQGNGIFGAVGQGAVIKDVTINCSATCAVLANALRAATVQNVNITVSKLDWGWSAATAFQIVGSTLSNVNIDASAVTNSSHVLCQTYSGATFTDVTLKAATDVVITMGNPETPDGVTVTRA